MKQIFFYFFLLPAVLISCKDSDRNTDGNPENDVDAARTFIRAALDGDYKKARTFLVNDSLNNEDFNAAERLYNERATPEDKNKYKEASIIIHETVKVNDSTSIVYYSNSYRNQKDSLKVVKEDDKWLIDFKYIFKHKTDSLP